ncbi:hypothetical protein F442_08102 [Phytophthora nicotianae P10297]|uniref:DUF5745 domain-containing protein n=1 Tax=Phytophthora nicotianae P10297 TaxID=1317064 RepID=W2ZES4_PHYNI|nr:hypothetical protein F442_08102 [Phytophthora nicotianae P10297]
MSAVSSHEGVSPLQNEQLSAPTDPIQAEKSTADQLLIDTNALLSKLGFSDRAFANVADLVASVSSMSVALYEKLFQFRLRDVERVPRTLQDYEHNAQVVADALRGALLGQGNDDDAVNALAGEKLCAGDFGSIRRLLTMLEQVYTLLFEESQEVGERLRDASLASLGMSATEVQKTVSKRRIPPKFAKKQRKEGAPKSDPGTTSREKRRTKETKSRSASQSRVSQKQEEVRVGRAVSAGELRKTSVSGKGRADVIAENNKKRSRLLDQSFKANSSRAENAAKKAVSRRAGVSMKTVTGRKQRKDDKELLETKPYGRFVTVGSTSSDEDKPQENANRNEVSDKQGVFFEGVSSVQHNSDESMHFMEDEGVFAQNFSSISIDDEPEQKDQEPTDDRENTQPNENTASEKPVTPRKSANHQEAEEDDELTSSPVKKKVARNEPHAPDRPSSRTRRDPSKSLYPLLPKTRHHTATSKAQAQYLRYKLSLKNHLQELRQREASQRQHLERAFKSGEHMANVDKIRSRRFEQDVRLHRIAIGLEAKNEEEKQLRQAMNHLLDLEKEKLREEHRLTTSMLKQIQKEHSEREQAMENFYANQIQLVKEQTRREVKERELVEKAQRSASEKMMRELRHERENQLTALLQKKQHLEETRRFRHASQMAHLLEKTEERSVKRTDAFYTAAMKARERHTVKKQNTQRRTSLDPYRVTSMPLRRSTTRFSKSTVR